MVFILELWSQGMEEMQFIHCHSFLTFKGLLCSVLNKERNCYLVTAGCIVRIMNNGKKIFKEEWQLSDVGDR